ncbi:MAG: ATP-dependent protease LonB [Nanoarchaeota archaeon]
MSELDFQSTAEINVPKAIIEQIIGQGNASDIIKKAASQRRNVLLIGVPGTGKSLLGQALAELLQKSKLSDVLAIANDFDENTPKIKTMEAGLGKKVIEKAKLQSLAGMKNQQFWYLGLSMIALILPWYIRDIYGDIMAAASLIAGMLFVGVAAISFSFGMRRGGKAIEPKLIVDNSTMEKAPFIDATGSHAGALLGDVAHDPLQSGGLGTPANQRVQAGAIHKANEGVLFIDEIATLEAHSQQELLTAMQEKKYPITGQSEKSSGAMTRTEPVPCDFILVAAGNIETVQKMHPALRSRIRGYGYEVYMNDTIPDTPENRKNIARFVAQEVAKDGKIPHFSKDAVEEVIKEAQRRAGRKGHLTLVLRDLGGLVRAAGDLAREENAGIVTNQHVMRAKKLARNLEQQMSDKYIERKKEYEIIKIKGEIEGRVNGLAVIGSDAFSMSGLVLPIEAEVTKSGTETKKFVATGKLGAIAKEAIVNVSAIIKKMFEEDMKKYDVYVQFLQTSEGVEGDSASIAVATAIISALKGIPVRQDTAMTGSLSVRGEVLPVGGVSQKVEAAMEAGIRQVIVPESNAKDVVLSNGKKVKIIPVKTIAEVLEHALDWKGKGEILKKIKKYTK